LDDLCQLCKDPNTTDSSGNEGKRWWRCKGVDSKTNLPCTQVWAYPCVQARILKHAAKCSGFLPSAKCSGFLPPMRARAEAALAKDSPGERAEKVLDKERASGSKDGDVRLILARRSDADYTAIVDQEVVKLICGLGISPYAVDSEWWKLFIQAVTCGRYSPKSGTTLVNSHISREAARVRELTIQHLQSDKVLYITYCFDAGATRRRASFLTIHAMDDSK
jgi:hypothetical protein